MSKNLLYAGVLALGLLLVMNIGIAGEDAGDEESAPPPCAATCTHAPAGAACATATACEAPKATECCATEENTKASACSSRSSCVFRNVAARCGGR